MVKMGELEREVAEMEHCTFTPNLSRKTSKYIDINL